MGPRLSSGEPAGTQAPAPGPALGVTLGSGTTKSFLRGAQRVVCIGSDCSPLRNVPPRLVAGVMKQKRRAVDYL